MPFLKRSKIHKSSLNESQTLTMYRSYVPWMRAFGKSSAPEPHAYSMLVGARRPRGNGVPQRWLPAMKMCYQAISARHLQLRAIFSAWRLLVVTNLLAEARQESTRLRDIAGKQSNSIWAMHKAQLVRIAERDLGMTLAEAEGNRVAELRDKSRKARGRKKQLDPSLKYKEFLKGITRKTVGELTTMASQVNVSPLDPTRRMGMKTKETLIHDIKEAVEKHTYEEEEGFKLVNPHEADGMQTDSGLPSSSSSDLQSLVQMQAVLQRPEVQALLAKANELQSPEVQAVLQQFGRGDL